MYMGEEICSKSARQLHTFVILYSYKFSRNLNLTNFADEAFLEKEKIYPAGNTVHISDVACMLHAYMTVTHKLHACNTSV